MKRKSFITILLLLLLIIPVRINAVVEKGEKEYVTDEGKLLTEEQEDYLVEYSDFIYKAKKISYYVVTVKNLGIESIEDYTKEVYDTYNISKNGILILISKEDRKIRIEVGEKLDSTFEENYIQESIDQYFVPYMEQGEWGEGIINGYNAIYKEICEKNGIDASSMEVEEEISFFVKYKTPILLFLVWLTSVLANKIGTFFLKAKYIKKEERKNIEAMKAAIYIVLNILILSASYLLESVYPILLIVMELAIFYSINQTKNEKSIKNKKRRRKTK